jgi:hypothetical protein
MKAEITGVAEGFKLTIYLSQGEAAALANGEDLAPAYEIEGDWPSLEGMHNPSGPSVLSRAQIFVSPDRDDMPLPT